MELIGPASIVANDLDSGRYINVLPCTLENTAKVSHMVTIPWQPGRACHYLGKLSMRSSSTWVEDHLTGRLHGSELVIVLLNQVGELVEKSGTL